VANVQTLNTTSVDTSMNDVDLPKTLASLSESLISRGLTITTAESCTGGLIAAALTSIAGSSDFFNAGIVSYSNESKRRLLGVEAKTLAEFGAVSEAVVLEMADMARRRNNADVAISVSGIAGPGGGSDDKPVGTVWIGWSTPEQQRHIISAQRFQFSGRLLKTRTGNTPS